jgi:hypothetical protein
MTFLSHCHPLSVFVARLYWWSLLLPTLVLPLLGPLHVLACTCHPPPSRLQRPTPGCTAGLCCPLMTHGAVVAWWGGGHGAPVPAHGAPGIVGWWPQPCASPWRQPREHHGAVAAPVTARRAVCHPLVAVLLLVSGSLSLLLSSPWPWQLLASRSRWAEGAGGLAIVPAFCSGSCTMYSSNR